MYIYRVNPDPNPLRRPPRTFRVALPVDHFGPSPYNRARGPAAVAAWLYIYEYKNKSIYLYIYTYK